MGNEDLAIRFSDKMYASKAEVSRILKLTQIDTIWSNIMSYRSYFTRTLELRNIDRTPFVLVLTPSMATRVNDVERKLAKIMVKFSKLADNDLSKYELRRDSFIKCLRSISIKYNLNATDDLLAMIFNNSVSSLTPSEMILSRYGDALKFVEKHYLDPLDEDVLANIYTLISGNNEIVSLYRLTDLNDSSSKAIIDRIYNAAPVEKIESLMSELLSFINNEDISFFIRALCAFYFVQYVKPFDCYSEEIALLLMKDILAHNELDELASLLELETLLIDEKELNEVLLEVQKTNDLTYLLDFTLNKIDSIIDELYERIMKSKARDIEHEFFKEDKIEEKDDETPYQEVRVEEEITPLSSHVDYEVKVALPLMPMGLDEKDAQRIEQSLMELNPNLKRGEAYFYARHCTIGKYYTIQQYKKELDCAYETARTSMDRLVYEGYYRKEMVKNKFVYTPIPRK